MEIYLLSLVSFILGAEIRPFTCCLHIDKNVTPAVSRFTFHFVSFLRLFLTIFDYLVNEKKFNKCMVESRGKRILMMTASATRNEELRKNYN